MPTSRDDVRFLEGFVEKVLFLLMTENSQDRWWVSRAGR
jgi:hypothetical protein